MPYYDLKCKECGNTFNKKASIEEKENNKIECPECSNNDLETVFGNLNYSIKQNNSCSNGSCGSCCGM